MATEQIGKQWDGIDCVSCGCNLTPKESREGTLCSNCSCSERESRKEAIRRIN